MKDNYWNQAMIGLALAYMLNLEDAIRSLFWNFCTLETSMVSAERCYAHTEIVQEAPSTKSTDPENWPVEGRIEFQQYSVRYRPETELVLKGLTFDIKGNERIGVVGRTGSGKSTLCLALLRILEADSGKILIDGQDIAEIGLQKVRSAITIISQDPTLFEGTLKFNIDPHGKFTNEDILRVVEKSNLNKILKYEGDVLDFNVFSSFLK